MNFFSVGKDIDIMANVEKYLRFYDIALVLIVH